MKTKILVFLSAILLMAVGTAGAQTLRGVVKDTAGEPVIGAYVLPVGNPDKGTVTALDGSFSLSVPAEVLQVSCLGFSDAEVSVNGKNFLEIVL